MEIRQNKEQPEKDEETIPEKYIWKRSYTLVLAANAFYIVFFYILMRLFQ